MNVSILPYDRPSAYLNFGIRRRRKPAVSKSAEEVEDALRAAEYKRKRRAVRNMKGAISNDRA